MKILAIRLKNLASLAGPFEIDFTAEPLASAGLFAITGPTGASKSKPPSKPKPCAWCASPPCTPANAAATTRTTNA
jgi:hypothetical protein